MLCFETKLSREPYLSALEAIPDGAARVPHRFI